MTSTPSISRGWRRGRSRRTRSWTAPDTRSRGVGSARTSPALERSSSSGASARRHPRGAGGGRIRYSSTMRSLIVGTAGHIDHGKSALVRALTGTDPDRLKEERERGITIDLGFAHLDLGGGRVALFIDVPGHERFVRNMLAGAHGIDAVLLTIAADESVMPQTREHFHICRLLGIPRGRVVLTK